MEVGGKALALVVPHQQVAVNGSSLTVGHAEMQEQ